MPTEFSKRTQAEIDRNHFAASTGALVQLSAPAYNEILRAAQKWLAEQSAMTHAQKQGVQGGAS